MLVGKWAEPLSDRRCGVTRPLDLLSAILKGSVMVLSLVLVTATAIPLLHYNQWWIRIFDFPRAQITIFGIILASCQLYGWHSKRSYEFVVLGLLVLAVGYQLLKMLPYTVLMPKQVLTAESPSDDANLSLLVANVLMNNGEVKAFLSVEREYDPDMILTLETD